MRAIKQTTFKLYGFQNFEFQHSRFRIDHWPSHLSSCNVPFDLRNIEYWYFLCFLPPLLKPRAKEAWLVLFTPLALDLDQHQVHSCYSINVCWINIDSSLLVLCPKKRIGDVSVTSEVTLHHSIVTNPKSKISIFLFQHPAQNEDFNIIAWNEVRPPSNSKSSWLVIDLTAYETVRFLNGGQK